MRAINFLAASMLLVFANAHAELLDASNAELDDVVGQAGVALSLEMRLNADEAGNSLCGTVALPMSECRLAISLNNRGTAGVNQEWLVMKGIYGRIYMPYITLDADTVTYTSDVDGSSKSVAAVKLGYGGPSNKILVQNLTISNMAVERDNLLTAAGTRGYAATSEEGFLGLQINGSAEISGTVKMFACNSDHPRC